MSKEKTKKNKKIHTWGLRHIASRAPFTVVVVEQKKNSGLKTHTHLEPHPSWIPIMLVVVVVVVVVMAVMVIGQWWWWLIFVTILHCCVFRSYRTYIYKKLVSEGRCARHTAYTSPFFMSIYFCPFILQIKIACVSFTEYPIKNNHIAIASIECASLEIYP